MHNRNKTQRDIVVAFYESEYDYLVSVGLYHKVDLNQIKDTIQQLFLDFYERKVNLQEVSNPRSYIITAFKRRLIDLGRAGAQKARFDLLFYQEIEDHSILHQIELRELSQERLALLRVAYEQLPARCRKVIFLKFYEGLSNEEIAHRTNLSMRSVYNNLSEGIKRLKAAVHSVRPPVTNKLSVAYQLLPLCIAIINIF